MNIEVQVSIDKVVLLYKDILLSDFERLLLEYDQIESETNLITKKYWLGTRDKDYKHNLNVKPYDGETSISFGFLHNSQKMRSLEGEVYGDCRVELNPNKLDRHSLVLAPLQMRWEYFDIEVRMCDIAVDLIGVPIRSVNVFSQTGMMANLYKGTKYFGGRSTDGHAKLYDKKKERKQKVGKDLEIEQTRFEYSWWSTEQIKKIVDDLGKEKRSVVHKGLPFSEFCLSPPMDVDARYMVSISGEGSKSDRLYDYLAQGIADGVIEWSDIPYRMQAKLKKAQESKTLLKVNDSIRAHWTSLVDNLKSLIFYTNWDKKSIAV